MPNDAHCHLFSARFFEALAREDPQGRFSENPAESIPAELGWDPPGTPEALAARWVETLDYQHVSRAVVIASTPGDEESVARVVAFAPQRFIGFFMVNPLAEDAAARVERGLGALGLRGVCLFPAMHRYSVHDPLALGVIARVASYPGSALFVHCGALTLGVRKKLGLRSRFDVRFANPLELSSIASEYPAMPVIVPHFGAGLLREALLLADLNANVYLDTSSTNRWIAYYPGLTLTDVLRQALLVAGPSRLLFGTDSSFFPRGWNRAIFDIQNAALRSLSVPEPDVALIQGGNLDRLFPVPA